MNLCKALLWLIFLVAPAGAQERDWEKEWNSLVAGAKKEGKVVVAGFPNPDLRRDIPARFTQRFGIPVEYIGANSNDTVARLRAERQGGLYTTDVFLSGIQVLTNTVYPQKMLEPIRPVLIHPEVTDPSKWKGGRLWFVDPEQKYILRFVNYVVELLHVNTDHVKPGEFKSIKELLNPKWKGKISAFDPTVPGTGSNTAAKFYFQLGEEFVRKLYIDQQPVIGRDRRQMTDWLARGTYPIALNPADVEGMQKDGFPIKGIYSLPDMPGVVSGGFGLVVFLNNAPHPQAARLFINWMVSREGVETYSRAVGHTTLRADADESFLASDKIPRPGVKYFDSYDWQFNLTGEEKVRLRMKELLQR